MSATVNSITINLYPSSDYGGAVVTNYYLEMNTGIAGSPFTPVASYITTSFVMLYTVTFATDGIITGQIYQFRFRSLNSKGYSDYSEILSVAAIDPPV